MKTVFELIEANGLTLHGDIEHFAELVRADEREACAKVAEDKGAMVQALLNVTSQPIAIAAAIRARSNT
jgi:cytosine/adenosine deaminase-related metal-dependent hydrolase